MRRHLPVWILLSWLVVQPYYPDMNQPLVVRIWRGLWYHNTWTAMYVYETRSECATAVRTFREHAQQRLREGGLEQWATHLLLAESLSRCVPADAVPFLPFSVRAHDGFDAR